MKKCEKYCNLQVHVLYIIYNLVKFCTICFVRGEWKRSTFVLLFYEICMYIIHVHFYYRHHYLDPYLSVYLFFFFSVLILGLCEMRQSVGQKTPFTYGVRKITGKSTYERKLIRPCTLHMPSHETIMNGNFVLLLFSSLLIMIQIKFQVWFGNVNAVTCRCW